MRKHRVVVNHSNGRFRVIVDHKNIKHIKNNASTLIQSIQNRFPRGCKVQDTDGNIGEVISTAIRTSNIKNVSCGKLFLPEAHITCGENASMWRPVHKLIRL